MRRTAGPLASSLAVVLLAACVQIVGAVAATADVTSYENVVTADQPYAFYPFDGKPTDTTFVNEAHQGDDAISVGGAEIAPAFNPFGNDGRDGSLGFNGGSAPIYAQAPNLPPLDGDNARTVELWFQTTNKAPQCLVASGASAHGQAFSICLTDGNQGASPRPGLAGIYVQFYDADVYVPWDGLAKGTWHYVAVTLSGTSVTVDIDSSTNAGYVWDGTAYSQAMAQPFTLPLVPDTSPSPVQLGGPGGWAPALHGVIDEVAVYPRALSPAELSRHLSAAVTHAQINVATYPLQAIVGRTLVASQVATFNYVAPPGSDVPPTASFSTSITWGDGVTTPGLVEAAPASLNPDGQSFLVYGTHTYTTPLTATLTVRVSTPDVEASASAPALVFPVTPSAAFVVNPTNPHQFSISLLMPQTPAAGQRAIRKYAWEFADSDAVVVDDPQNDKVINDTLTALAASPGSTPLRARALLLGILPKDANDLLGGWTNDQVLQLVTVWQAYFPQHIVPHAFDYFGTVGIRLTITDAGGATSSYVQNPQIGIACLPWGGPWNRFFGGYNTCDTINGFAVQFGRRRAADYVSFGISGKLPSLPTNFGGGLTLTLVGPVHSGDPIAVYAGVQLSAGVGVSTGGTGAQAGWLGPPDRNDPPASQGDVNNFVGGMSISAGANLQLANIGAGFTAIESPTSVYPAGERLAGQPMVGEEIPVSLGKFSDSLFSASAAASVGCSGPVGTLPSLAQAESQTLYRDATTGTPSATAHATSDLQTLLNALAAAVPRVISSAIVACTGVSY